MPTKRDVLQHLKRDELLAAADRFDLEVSDRRARAVIADALASSRKSGLADILEDLSRVRLKEICRALDLDDSGREKAALVARLAGRDGHAATPKPEPKAAPVARNLRPSRPSPSPAEGKLSREALERHLWSAADILRGSIDSSDYKNYILGLLFLKRLSDRFEEECEIVRAEGGNPEDPDEHQFYVPPAARWERISRVASNIGEEMNRATEALEEKNPKLEGVLHGIDYNDERKLGDVKQRDQVLGDLIVHFSEINLRNDHLSEPDILGRAYEYLIERFADDAGKKGGEFYTPHQVVRLMVEILRPREGMRICDPTCGSGGMLIQCAHYVRRNGGDPRNLSLYGQEKNLGTWAICKMNMLLHGLEHEIMKGDTIREPKLLDEDGNLRQFDLVIANPPFSLDNWGREAAENDSYRRFRFGLPPKNVGDMAFIQHMVSTLALGGRMAVVMPHGVLFRGSSEEEIRRGLVDEDLLEAVIGLAPGLFYGTGIPATILIFSKAKTPAQRGKVLFVNAAEEKIKGKKQNNMTDPQVETIATLYHGYRNHQRMAHVASLAEIAGNDYNLNIPLYIDLSGERQGGEDLAAELRNLKAAIRDRQQAENAMLFYLRELGIAEN
jgi:type I restriction enzyme M protein